MSRTKAKNKNRKRITKASGSIPSKKRSGRIKYIIFSTILLAVVLLIVNPSPYKKPNRTATNTTGPVFKKEGELSLYKSNIKQKILNLDIEIAENDYERAQGLMYRKKLGSNKGMLFIMDAEEPQSFWMKNTYIPLDIMYLDRKRKIISIHKYTQPMSVAPVLSSGPAKYVLEVDAGVCDSYGISTGDSIAYIRQ